MLSKKIYSAYFPMLKFVVVWLVLLITLRNGRFARQKRVLLRVNYSTQKSRDNHVNIFKRITTVAAQLGYEG